MALNKQNKSKATSQAEAAVTVPDAVIFVSGLTHEASQYPLDEISLLLANALDNADNVTKAKFRVGEVGTDSLTKSGDTQTATIFREQDGQEAAVVKVYGMNYSSEVLGPYRDLPPLLKFLLLPVTFIPLARTWIPSIRGKSLSGREKWQFWLLGFVLLLLFLYGVLLITSVINSIGALQPSPATTDSAGATEPSPTAEATAPPADPAAPAVETSPGTVQNDADSGAQLRKSWADLMDLMGNIQALAPRLVLWATVAGLVVPTRAQVLEALDNGATILMAAIQYHWIGRGRPRARGQLNSLLQDILESPEAGDARIHILTHSFGSIVALDTLFRSDLEPQASFGRIHSLVTIGSPFDFIHMMWPQYFHNRKRVVGLRWINIFAPQDVLSSNFLKESKVKTVRARKLKPSLNDMQSHSVAGLVPDFNLVYRPTDAADQLEFIDILFFVGFSSHNLYWERGKKQHSNAFELAISEMFADTSADMEAPRTVR